MIDARQCDDGCRVARLRREHLTRIGYDDANYRRPELQWAQRNFVHAQMMVEDRFFFDPDSGTYTVDRYLDDLEARFGGIDSVLIWYVYPNIGVDDRNQFDLARDLPGGIEGLKGAVDDFHRRGVRGFLPTMPWEPVTRAVGRSDGTPCPSWGEGGAVGSTRHLQLRATRVFDASTFEASVVDAARSTIRR